MNLMNAFKKKNDDVPDVSSMLANGMSQQDIIDSLRQQGYDSTTIKDALVDALKNQSTRQNAPNQEAPHEIETMSTPMMQQIRQQPQQQSNSLGQQSMNEPNLENVQQILEQIIEEKWKSSATDLNSLKSSVNINENSIEMIKDQIEKLGQRIDNIQNTMIGKTEEYNKTISDVNVELQAFEKVIDRLVPAISDSIKELRDLIDGLKPQKKDAS